MAQPTFKLIFVDARPISKRRDYSFKEISLSSKTVDLASPFIQTNIQLQKFVLTATNVLLKW